MDARAPKPMTEPASSWASSPVFDRSAPPGRPSSESNESKPAGSLILTFPEAYELPSQAAQAILAIVLQAHRRQASAQQEVA